MNIYKYQTIILVLLLILKSAAAQEDVLKAITVQNLKHHLSIIASDSMQGRSFDMPSGLNSTAEYLRQNVVEMGLKPGVEGYFQEFVVHANQPVDKNSFLSILNPEKTEVFRTPSVICTNSKTERLELQGSVVFAGFGLKDNLKEYDDFANIDVSDKVVLFSAGTPETFRNKKDGLTDYRAERRKVQTAFEKGAKAVVVVTGLHDRKNISFHTMQHKMKHSGYSLAKANSNPKPMFVTIPETAGALFGGKRKYRQLLASIAKNRKPNSFPINEFSLKINTERDLKPVQAKNVIAVIEGSDSLLKNEYVVYMAHYDHLGKDEKNNIYNGADDNGSGTAALLELAKAYKNLENKPPRSILFLWVTGEEYGMLGSGYYADNPAFPLEKTVACINLDMIGRVYEPRDSVWKDSAKLVKDSDGVFTLVSNFSPELETITSLACSKLKLVADKSLPEYFFRSSDQFHFHRQGIPILNLSTGYHADYHKVTDEVSGINFEKMKRIVDLAYLTGFEVAQNGLSKEKNP